MNESLDPRDSGGGRPQGRVPPWLETLSSMKPAAIPTGADRAITQFTAANRLTPREAQILCLVCCGLKNDQIAERLSLSTPTVRFHLRNLHEKTSTSDKLEIVLRIWHMAAG